MNPAELEYLELGNLRSIVPAVTRVGSQLRITCPYSTPDRPCDDLQTSDLRLAIAFMATHTLGVRP